MTVINMISFGEEGVAVADEQSSTNIRRYNVAQKLHFLGDAFVYGGSGPADCVKEVYDLATGNIAEIRKNRDHILLDEVFRLTERVVINYKSRLKDKLLNMHLGISLDDLLSGVLSRAGNRPLDESAKNAGRGICAKIDEDAAMGILLGGIENGHFDIYHVDTSYGGRKLSRPYGTIGSGADESDKVLSGYVAGLPRKKRDSIDKQAGLITVIEATNASSNLNLGVGGSPSIVYVSKDGIIEPDENQCILASELVKGLSWRLLNKRFVYDAVAKLVYENVDFNHIYDEMMKVSPNPKKLERLLRGYKE